MPQVIESFQEWSARQGGDPLQVGERLLFSNGAECDLDQGKFRREPPDDPTHRLQLRRRYVKELLRRAEKAFFDARAAATEQAALATRYANLPAPGENDVKRLHHLRNIALQCRAELAAVEQQLAETPTGRAHTERAALLQKREAEIAAIHGQLVGVTLDGELPDDDALALAGAMAGQKLVTDVLAKQAGIRPSKDETVTPTE